MDKVGTPLRRADSADKSDMISESMEKAEGTGVAPREGRGPAG